MKKQILLLALFIVPSLINAAQQMTAAERLALKTAIEMATAESKKQEALYVKRSVQDLLNARETGLIINSRSGTYKIINLKNKGLTSLEGLENIPGVEKAELLNADNNIITDIEDIFNKNFFPKLDYINLTNNCISSISNTAFKNCSAVKWIDLNNNKLKIINGVFNDKNLTTLIEINLANNSINSIDSTTFRGIPMLKKINLKHNKINTLKDFLSMPHLHKKLPKENEYSKDEIIFITLNENPLSDSDEDAIEAFKLNNHLSMIITNREKEKKEKEAQIKREEAFLKNAEAAKYELEHPNKAWFKKIFGSK